MVKCVSAYSISHSEKLVNEIYEKHLGGCMANHLTVSQDNDLRESWKNLVSYILFRQTTSSLNHNYGFPFQWTDGGNDARAYPISNFLKLQVVPLKQKPKYIFRYHNITLHIPHIYVMMKYNYKICVSPSGISPKKGHTPLR